MKITRITLEDADVYALVNILLGSIFLVTITILVNVIITNYEPFSRGLFEEILRLIFAYVVFRFYGLISTPCIVFSFAEILFSVFLNIYLFDPIYFRNLNFELISTISSILIIAIVGFLSGMVYLANNLKGNSILWGIFIIVPIKISIYLFNQWLVGANINCVTEVSIKLVIFLALISISHKIYKRNLNFILKLREHNTN